MKFIAFIRRVGSILLLLLTVLSFQPLECRELTVQIPGNGDTSKVPAWNSRGLGPLPWQGIACADLTLDGRFIAVGTVAPVGDPQVFVLDEKGTVISQYTVGERGANEVAISQDGTLTTCLIPTPRGTSGDEPQLKCFTQGSAEPTRIDEYAVSYNDFFHYGDHSNHEPQTLRSSRAGLIIAGQGKVSWQGTGVGRRSASAAGAPLISLAANAAGCVVVGEAVSARALTEKSTNLTVLDPGGTLLWQRAVSDDVMPAPAMEEGIYGRTVSPYQDVKVWAPLSVAISEDGVLVAAVDYQGWQRLFDRGDNYGLRFMPVKPVVQVYTADGAVVRRFGPETFATPGWYDLAFTTDAKRLLAYPHSWTSRGLGGQPRLPADGDAGSLYALDIATGDVTRADFPDAIAGVAVGASGELAVSCWDGNIYLRGDNLQPVSVLADRLEVGGPCILRMSQDGSKLLAARWDGTVCFFAGDGKELWRADLNKLATPGEKPWTKNQRLGQHGLGVWVKSGQRTHSDMGSQYIIEAPDGLLLVDPNAGLSFEQNWAQIKGAGLDPMQVKFVLLTHEHGDHAPGAFLWRIVTGAQVVSSPEMAYTLQHHIFIGTGYGFHPPQPTDILVDHDQDLTLAGLKVRVVYLSGHTFGSLGYIFEKDGNRYAALGDLIMPGGALGYSGAVNFSAQDVLASLRKLDTYKPDVIIGGHGDGAPENFIAKGIGAALATGWAEMPPATPDPLFGFTQRNYLVLNWMQPVNAVTYGDVDGDGKPDLAFVTRDERNTLLKVFLNKDGKFGGTADTVQPVSGFPRDNRTKLRLLHINNSRRADFLIGSESQAVILLAQEGQPAYRIARLPQLTRITQALVGDFNRDGRNDLLLGGRFIENYYFALQDEDGSFRVTAGGTTRRYFDMQLLDVNDDGQDDLITSAGAIFPRQPDGTFPPRPSIQLELAVPGWSFMAAADFSGDGKPDIAILNIEEKSGIRVSMHYHTGDMEQPYATAPSTSFVMPGASEQRDGPTVADWNCDGIPDLVLTLHWGAMILLGSEQGLAPNRFEQVKLDYDVNLDNRLGVTDFTGNGKPDLASWGPSSVGALAIYIWTR